MAAKATYNIVSVTDHIVTIRDLSDVAGTMSITNDAEAVVEDVLRQYPGRRILYFDSELALDELVHDGQRFVRFQTGDWRDRENS